MVADIIDHPQHLVAEAAQATAKLLQEKDRAFRRPQHQNGADVRHVDAFVEHVDGEDDVEVPFAERLKRRSARGRSRPGMDRDRAQARGGEIFGHEFCMTGRNAETDRRALSMQAQLLQRVPGPGTGRNRRCQRRFIKTRRAPRDLGVIHLVRHAEIMEGRQQAPCDALMNVAAEHQVLAAERQQVAAIAALGCRGQAQEEAGCEIVEQATVTGRRGMMKLVDDDVVEVVGREAAQVLGPAQCLDRGKDDLAFLFCRAGIAAEARLGTDLAKSRHGLCQDLFAMCHKEHPVKGAAVEGGKPGLAKAGRQHHEAREMSLPAGQVQSGQCLGLDAMRFGNELQRLGLGYLGGERRQRPGPSPGGICIDPCI